VNSTGPGPIDTLIDDRLGLAPPSVDGGLAAAA
jgi:hypothetical protein